MTVKSLHIFVHNKSTKTQKTKIKRCYNILNKQKNILKKIPFSKIINRGDVDTLLLLSRAALLMLMPYFVLVVKGFFNGWQSKSRRTRGYCTVLFTTADRKFEIPVSYDCLLSTTTMRLLSEKQMDYCTTKDYETQQSSKYGSIISRIPYALDYTCSMGKRLIIIKHVTTISVDSSESGSGVRSKPPLSPWTRSLD